MGQTVQPQMNFGLILLGINNMIKTNSLGFTFIELILYLGIVTIVLMAIVPFGITVIASGAKSSTQQEVYDQSRLVSEKLLQQIRGSNGINTGSSNFDVNIASSAGQLSLSQADSTANPTIIDVSGGKIRIKRGAGVATTLNSTNTTVSSLVFTNYSSSDGKSKNVGFVMTIIANYNSAGQQYQESVTVRSDGELRSN